MSRVLIASVLLLFVVSTTRAAEELLPPFGFRWNDPMSRVDAVLKGAKATIISREKKENRELWTVEGLVHPGLKRTLFTFKSGALRSEERRVGKECRSRRSPYHLKEKSKQS